MDITLTKPELERFVDEQVRAGHFSSPADIVEASLARLMLDPAPEELDDIWFYMNWRLNFARIEHETRPEKLEQLKAHLHVLSDVISPENAFALRALSTLDPSPEISQRLAARLETSPYWRERFEALGLQ